MISTLRIKEIPSLRAMVEGKLREGIVSGIFKPGQRLVERELCEMIGVSRPSIREALRLLEAEGLVRIIAHRGPIVNIVTVEEAEQLYTIRALLEGFAGRECARLRDRNIGRRLREAVKQFETAVVAADRVQLLAAETQFFSVLMDGCGNVFLERLLSPLHQRITLLRATSMFQPGRLRQSLREMAEIARAIDAGDVRRAEWSCVNHVRSAAKVALEVLRQSQRGNETKKGKSHEQRQSVREGTQNP